MCGCVNAELRGRVGEEGKSSAPEVTCEIGHLGTKVPRNSLRNSCNEGGSPFSPPRSQGVWGSYFKGSVAKLERGRRREEVCTLTATNNHWLPSGLWLPFGPTLGEASFHPGLGRLLEKYAGTAFTLTAFDSLTDPPGSTGALTVWPEPLSIPEFLTDSQDQYSDCFTCTDQHLGTAWPSHTHSRYTKK